MHHEKLIIFDCDGVLVDTELLSAHALSEYLQILGIVESAQSLRKRYKARAFQYTIADLAKRYPNQITDHFETHYRRHLYALYRAKLQPIAGIKKALEKINGKKCVASNAPKEKLDLVLQITDLANFFPRNRVFSAYEIDSWKPAPGLFLHAAKTMDFSPRNSIVVEDSTIGVEAALKADMQCLYYDPENENPEFTSPGVTRFHSMAQLPGLLTSLEVQNARLA